MTRSIFILSLLMILGFQPLVAQTYSKCGTQVTPAQVAAELALPNPTGSKSMFVPDKCFGKTLSVTVHIVSDSLGDYGVSAAQVTNAIQALNPLFAPICISFEVCHVNYIENYKYDRFLKTIEEEEIINLYSVPNTINIYFAKTVETQPGSFVGGYAYLPGGPDFIIIGKSALGAIPHEMGHFFGLYHTFEAVFFGPEFANGSNCATAGDLVCDTPADPGLGNKPAPDCNLDPGTQDANGDWYVPDVGNIMSYYTDDCQCGFTTQQYNRMAARYLASRFYLW